MYRKMWFQNNNNNNNTMTRAPVCHASLAAAANAKARAHIWSCVRVGHVNNDLMIKSKIQISNRKLTTNNDQQQINIYIFKKQTNRQKKKVLYRCNSLTANCCSASRIRARASNVATDYFTHHKHTHTYIYVQIIFSIIYI